MNTKSLSPDYKNSIIKAHEQKRMILPNGSLVDMDGIRTSLNNNVIAMGTSGARKTRGFLIPNLLAAVDSYIVSDAKGSLYKNYASYFKEHGYKVVHINFIHPDKSDGFNPFMYIKSPDEVMKLAHYLTYAGKNPNYTGDPFWDKASELLLSAIIGYMIELKRLPPDQLTIVTLCEILTHIDPNKIEDGEKCRLDEEFEEAEKEYAAKYHEPSWSYRQYKKFRQTPPKTFNCILSTLHSNIGLLDTPSINSMMKKPTLNFARLGLEKTIVFVEVSDTDRSKDILINTFYTQAMNQLCTFADEKCENNCLPIPVRFMLDDFGTNCRIENFENMISNIRSRNISATIILQSESQLVKGYGPSAQTIIDNCDTLIYMGGRDENTVQKFSRFANVPFDEMLNMPLNTNWVFRRGTPGKYSRTVDFSEYALLPENKNKMLDMNAVNY